MGYRRALGFTLIELLVTVAVAAILVTLAAPSFRTIAERSALRGASDGIEGVISAAKEEAIKRDAVVRVDLKPMGTGLCVGASTATAGCDCAASAAACDVAAWPATEGDLRRVVLESQPSFGGDGTFSIDPRTGTLAELTDTGGVTLATTKFAVRVQLNAVARPSTCTPAVDGKEGLPNVDACP